VRDFHADARARSPQGVQLLRGLCERALAACGLHPQEGGAVWALRRGVEAAAEAAAPGAEAAQRVRQVFHRQLAVPLMDAAQTMAAYEAWERAHAEGGGGGGDVVPRAVRRAFDFAGRALELRRPFEAAVAPRPPGGEADALAGFLAYARLEASGSDAARAAVAYERALAAFPLTHHLWLAYGRHAEAHAPAAAAAVYARAARNCPWVGEVWARGMRHAERAGAPAEAQDALYEAARGAGLGGPEDHVAVALARADALRRRGPAAAPALRAAFSEAAALLAAQFPDYHDPQLALTAYWAESEARSGEGGAAASRAVWEAALRTAAGRHAEAWVAYAEAERRGGRPAEARAVYKRAHARRLEARGAAAAVCRAWLRFEREEGSAAEHFEACALAEPVLEAAAAEELAAADEAAAAAAAAAAEAAPKRELSREESRALRQGADPNFKRRAREEGRPGRDAPLPPRSKKPRPAEPEKAPTPTPTPAPTPAPQQVAAPSLPLPQGAVAAASLPAAVAAAPPGPPAPRPAPAAPTARQAERQSLTAFVKHLDEAVDEAALRALFAGRGEVRRVKVATEPATGRHKASLRAVCGPCARGVRAQRCSKVPCCSSPPPTCRALRTWSLGPPRTWARPARCTPPSSAARRCSWRRRGRRAAAAAGAAAAGRSGAGRAGAAGAAGGTALAAAAGGGGGAARPGECWTWAPRGRAPARRRTRAPRRSCRAPPRCSGRVGAWSSPPRQAPPLRWPPTRNSGACCCLAAAAAASFSVPVANGVG
jgi:hypothetical protein